MTIAQKRSCQPPGSYNFQLEMFQGVFCSLLLSPFYPVQTSSAHLLIWIKCDSPLPLCCHRRRQR